jgi:hypothetical protein
VVDTQPPEDALAAPGCRSRGCRRGRHRDAHRRPSHSRAFLFRPRCRPRSRGAAGPGFVGRGLGGAPRTTSETPSFCRPNRSRLVGLALRPSTPAPREQRQPKREQRAEATDSEAHGIPAGPVFRFRSGLRRAVWLAPWRARPSKPWGCGSRSPPAAVTPATSAHPYSAAKDPHFEKSGSLR